MPMLRFPWTWPRRTSPPSEQQSVDDPASYSSVSLSDGSVTAQGTRYGECCIGNHDGPVSSVNFSSDGKHVIAGGCDGVFRWWDVKGTNDQVSREGQPVRSEEASTAAVSRDGMWLILSGTHGPTVSVWSTSTRERVLESIAMHKGKIIALDVSPDSSKVASGSRDGTVIIWCLRTGRHIAGPLRQGQSVLSVQFSPAGDRLASSGPDYCIHVWSICSDGRLHATPIRAYPAYSLAWSNDGRFLFIGSQMGSICCFDVSNSRRVESNWPIRPHFDSVSTLCLSNNGKFIISASRSECYVKIWDVRTQSEIRCLEHTSEVLDAKISLDDSYLVIGTKIGRIYVWDLTNELQPSYLSYSLTTRLIPTHYPDSHLILTEISGATYVLLKNGELATAEAILSDEVGRDSNLLCYYLVNRALVRARMQKWEAAMDDLQEVIHPSDLSPIAFLVRAVTLSGKGMYDAAIEALSTALGTCNPVDGAFFGAIKAIISFNAGNTKAMCHIADLGDRHPHIAQPCAFIQARMCYLLAEDAMHSQQYHRAIVLYSQARDLCPHERCPELDTLSLISGWVFDGLRLTIHRRSCEACYAAERMQELLDGICTMESAFRHEIDLTSGLAEWLVELKSGSARILEAQGDVELGCGNYTNAVARYSEALSIEPVVLQKANLFAKRSEAWMASRSWENVLRDADEAIRLDPSSPCGYKQKHAALHELARYEDAIETLKSLITTLENSLNPDIRRMRSDFVNPLETEKEVLAVINKSILRSPIRLLDTASGKLCDAEERKSMFLQDTTFRELVSSMPNEIHRGRIKTVTGQYLQYVMLSHRWGAEELKLADVEDKSIYDLQASPSAMKLQGFCRVARDAEIRWAWSDTCCIDKTNDVEFERSIHSMFRWYHCSAATIVYLGDVAPQSVQGALGRSEWLRRGWTLQELLAPRVIRFYYTDWTPYLNDTSLNHKHSPVIMQELQEATGVRTQALLALKPGPEEIQVKLQLASTRETTFGEDMAYGLFGIFGMTLSVIHGEGQKNALGRLFQKIVACSGDVTCIAWAGRSSEFNSAFPEHLRAYEHPSHTVPRMRVEDIEREVTNLRQTWSREYEAQAMKFYGRLHSHPSANCMSQNLYLPCIIFRLTALSTVKRTDGVYVHRASANALADTNINTEERLLSNNQSPKDLILVCPWIYELLGAIPARHGRHRQQNGDSESPSENDSNRESEPGHLVGISTQESHIVSGSRDDPSLVSLSGSPPPLDSQGPLRRGPESTLEVMKLVVRFRQPLGALLLLALGRGQYKRVATNTDIVIRVRHDLSFDDMHVKTLHII